MRRNHGQLRIPFIIDNKFFDLFFCQLRICNTKGIITSGRSLDLRDSFIFDFYLFQSEVRFGNMAEA